MRKRLSRRQMIRFALPAFLVALLVVLSLPISAPGQSTASAVNHTSPTSERDEPLFRAEATPVGNDAELLTLFGNLQGLGRGEGTDETNDVPLVSILRDTLGDSNPENDRLRYVWNLTYVSPSFGQRLASAVPFLYSRVGNKKRASSSSLPPPVIDLAAPEHDAWERFMWMALRNVLFNPYGAAAKSSASAYRRNAETYRKAHILRALAILSLYEAETGTRSALTPAEMREIRGRLLLTDKTLGAFVDDAYLQAVYEKQSTAWHDTRGHNWELLRQRAEAEGLYFEPLLMPDGGATHALVWVSRLDLQKNRGRKFDRRFLNVSNPWTDGRLERWEGHVEVRHLDAENRPVQEGAEGSRRVELIPLALYGLEHPKIPSLLVDFRDGSNPKRREMSRRVIEDVTRNLLAVARFGDLHYFLGRTVFDFVTDRRGMDVNQQSRVRAYAQLKLLISLDASLDPDLREEIGSRLERVSLNPLENDLHAEARLARQQHAALLEHARRPDGLAARLERDRRAEMVPLRHGRAPRVLFRLANILSLGFYEHREDANATEQRAALDVRRRLAYNRRFLRDVAKAGPRIEVVWGMEEVRKSLRFVAEHGEGADPATAAATARIFGRTEDEETRRLCLAALYRINNQVAKKELLRIYQVQELDPGLRQETAEYLRRAVKEERRVAPQDARTIISVIGQ